MSNLDRREESARIRARILSDLRSYGWTTRDKLQMTVSDPLDQLNGVIDALLEDNEIDIHEDSKLTLSGKDRNDTQRIH